MWVFLLVFGLGSLGYGSWAWYREYSAWDSEGSMNVYRQQMQEHQDDFLSQFQLTQESLQTLYATDIEDLHKELNALISKTTLVHELLLTEVLERQLVGVDLSPLKKEQLRKVLQLSAEGCSQEEIARILNIGVGEVLLLKQLKKS